MELPYFLYPLLCWWALGCWERCCCEHLCTSILFEYFFSLLLGLCLLPGSGTAGSRSNSVEPFEETSSTFEWGRSLLTLDCLYIMPNTWMKSPPSVCSPWFYNPNAWLYGNPRICVHERHRDPNIWRKNENLSKYRHHRHLESER